jgi:hypothetical protein
VNAKHLRRTASFKNVRAITDPRERDVQDTAARWELIAATASKPCRPCVRAVCKAFTSPGAETSCHKQVATSRSDTSTICTSLYPVPSIEIQVPNARHYPRTMGTVACALEHKAALDMEHIETPPTASKDVVASVPSSRSVGLAANITSLARVCARQPFDAQANKSTWNTPTSSTFDDAATGSAIFR